MGILLRGPNFFFRVKEKLRISVYVGGGGRGRVWMAYLTFRPTFVKLIGSSRTKAEADYGFAIRSKRT